MAAHDLEVRKAVGRVGGLTTALVVPDIKAHTAPARAASPTSLSRWVIEVDPNQQMSEAERHAVAKAAHSLYMSRMALKGAQKRAAARKAALDSAAEDEHEAAEAVHAALSKSRS